MPNLSQIKDFNFNFQPINPTEDNGVRSFDSFVNTVIQKSQQNKSILEGMQTEVSNMPVGNGNDDSKKLFLNTSKKYGNKIKDLVANSKGITGYAFETKDVDKLQMDMIQDSAFQALKEAQIHSQQLIGQLFGKDEEYIMNNKGEKVAKKKLAADYTDQEKQVAYNQFMKESTYSKFDENGEIIPISDPRFYTTKGKVQYNPGKFNMPEKPDIDEELSKLPNVQKFKKIVGDKWTGLADGISKYQQMGIEGVDWEGLNNAIKTTIQDNPKYREYLNRKVELDEIAKSSDGKPHFNLAQQNEQDIKKVQFKIDETLGSKGEQLNSHLNQLNSSKNLYDINGVLISDEYGRVKNENAVGRYSELQNFYRQNGITKEDNTPEKIVNKIKQAESYKINKTYDVLAEQYKLDNMIPLSAKLTDEQLYQLGKEYKVDTETSKLINTKTNINKSIYEKTSQYVVSENTINLYDQRKKKREEDELNKVKVNMLNANMVKLEEQHSLPTTLDKYKHDSDVANVTLANVLIPYGYNKDKYKSVDDFLSQHDNLYNQDVSVQGKTIKIKDLVADAQNNLSRSHNAQLQINETLEAIKNNQDVKKELEGDIWTNELLTSTNRDEYIAKERQRRIDYNNAINNDPNKPKSVFDLLSTPGTGAPANMKGGYLGSDLTDAALISSYNQAVSTVLDKAKGHGITEVEAKSTGRMIVSDMPKEETKEMQHQFSKALILGTLRIKNDDGTFEAATGPKGQEILNAIQIKSKQSSKNGEINYDAFSINPYITNNGKSTGVVIVNGKTYDYDATGIDPLGRFDQIPALTIAESWKNPNLTNEMKQTQRTINFGQIGSQLTGEKIIHTESGKPLSIPTSLADQKADVEGLRGNEKLIFKSSDGKEFEYGKSIDGKHITVHITDINGNKYNVGDIINPNYTKDKGDTGVDFDTFEDSLPFVAEATHKITGNGNKDRALRTLDEVYKLMEK